MTSHRHCRSLPAWCFVGTTFVAWALTACSTSPGPSPPAPSQDGEEVVDAPTAPPPDVSDETLALGANLYGQWCAFCHGANGEGYLADNANALANPRFLEAATDEFLRLGTIHGRPGTPMSAWGQVKGGPLDDAQVEAIVAFVRSWATLPQADIHDDVVEGGVATRGAPLYNALCASCHGTDGDGITAVSLNNPWFHETASDGFLRHAIVHGRPGTPMPAYGDELNARQIADLVAHIRSWRRPVDTAPPPPYAADFDHLLVHPEGPRAQFTAREDRFVPVDDAFRALEAGESFMFLDARPLSDYQISHITGAVGIPFFEVAGVSDRLPRDAWILAYCGCPHAVSGQAVDVLRAEGFTRVAILDEGFYVWESRGYPVTRPTAEAAGASP